MLICSRCLPPQLLWSKNWQYLSLCVWLLSSFFFCFIWGRLVELFLPGPISPHWGVLSKCLAYSKAASDPFVYSLLRNQYRKTCSLLANKLLRRSQLNSSSLMLENSIRRSDNRCNTNNNIQPPTNKPLGQWWPSSIETMIVFPGCKCLDLRYTPMRRGVW